MPFIVNYNVAMVNVIKAINRMVEKGLIDDYAIGGGIAAMFYIEPFLTYDVDIFILIEQGKKGRIILLSPVYNYLNGRGYPWKGEHIIIEGIPVQFIPADELETEAVRNARKILFKGIATKIVKPEYLIAILLKAGRKKDLHKIEKILEEAKVDRKKLKEILAKYDLKEEIKRQGLL